MSLRVGSLFTGVGGFDLGLESVGMEVVWQVENDRFCREVLRARWPDVNLYGDVRDVGADQLEPVDLVCGGFPCQDVSVAGRREGLAGSRSGLFFEFVRIARAVDARWLLVENVPGLLSSNGGADFATVLRELTGFPCAVPSQGWSDAGVCEGPLGRAIWRVLDTQYFGPPQRRRRVFVVVDSRAECRPEVLLEPEGVPGHPAAREQAGEVAPTIPASGAGVSRPGGPGLGSEEEYVVGWRPEGVSGAISAKWAKGYGGPAGDEYYNLVPADPVDAGSLAFKPSHFTRGKDGAPSDTYPPLSADADRGDQDPVIFRKRRRAGEDADSPETWGEATRACTLDSIGHAARTAHVALEGRVRIGFAPAPMKALYQLVMPGHASFDAKRGLALHGSPEGADRASPLTESDHKEPQVVYLRSLASLYDNGGRAVAFEAKRDGRASSVSPPLRAMSHDTSHENAGGQVGVLHTARPRWARLPCPWGTVHRRRPRSFQASDYRQGEYEETDRSRPITTSADRTRAAPLAVYPTLRENWRNNSNPVTEAKMLVGSLTGSGGGPDENDAKDGRIVHENLGGSVTRRETATSLREGASHSYQFVEQAVPRRLTPRECERLQGFPDDWTTEGRDPEGEPTKLSDTQRYKQMGNAVTVPVAAWIGARIVREEER